MIMRRIACCLALSLPMAPGQAIPEDVVVDVALVLAVDVSHSVSSTEALVQREGYAAAFESDQVLAAIRRGFEGRIAVAYVEWSSPDHQRVVVDWTIVDGPERAAELAGRLRANEPKSGGTTSISSALSFSEHMLKRVPWDAERRIIDVSGDGPHNFGADVTEVRRRIVADGIVINGLPIKGVPSGSFDLVDYYERNVIGGAGAFLVAAAGIDDFASAVRTKITFEIAGLSPAEDPRGRRYAMLER